MVDSRHCLSTGLQSGPATGGISIVRPRDDRPSPTQQISEELTAAFRYFNDVLFFGVLPDCVITFRRSQKTLGYFRKAAFKSADGVISHEIGLNASVFKVLPLGDALSTLAALMVRLWRHELGPPTRGGRARSDGYCDRATAEKMEEIGLLPTDNGGPDGRRTGYKVRHMIVTDGPFDRYSQRLLASGFRLTWRDLINPNGTEDGSAGKQHQAAFGKPNSKKDRARFTCPICRLNAWAKLSARLVCASCRTSMARSG